MVLLMQRHRKSQTGAMLLVVHFTVNIRNICKQGLCVFTRVLLSLVIASYLGHKNKFYFIGLTFCCIFWFIVV